VYGYGNFAIGLDPKLFHKLHIKPVFEKLKLLTLLHASLPVTTYCCTENKLAEISEQIQKDYSQSKLIVKSADLTENGYPRTLTSSHPSDNVIKTSAEVTRQAKKSHEADHD